jgi:hypothetical protein
MGSYTFEPDAQLIITFRTRAGLEPIFPIAPTIPPMNTPDYPGKGLSLPQLIFALNEELRRAAYPTLCVVKERSERIRLLTTPLASTWTRSLDSNATFRPHLWLSVNG